MNTLLHILNEVEEGDLDYLSKNINASNSMRSFLQGATISRVLGSGSQGTAFLLSSGKVLKLSDDYEEANSAIKLKGKRHKNVVEIYDVATFKFKDKVEANNNNKIYAILEEKLNFDANVVKEVKRFLKKAPMCGDLMLGNYDELKERFLRQYPDDNFLHKFLDNMIEAYKFMNQFGIQYGDLHEFNVGKRGNDFVIFDLGLSKSPRTYRDKVVDE